MVAACFKRFGRIDILVNNVDGSAKDGPEEVDAAAWDAQVDLNRKSVSPTCRAALPGLAAQGSGAIRAHLRPAPDRGAQSAYAATTAAVFRFSREGGRAGGYAPKGVRVNTVAPGRLHSPMMEARLADQRAGGDVAALPARRVARIPLGFMGDGRDPANGALFLAPEVAGFLTGTEIVVDGGMIARRD
jgi:NAD(P)-dependent dehydrogenase (short-subunit alcohol dehydrogenase family)